MKKVLLLTATLIFTFLSSNAQEIILTSGGEASGAEGTASYSIGQVVYTINTGTNGSVAQGVQQAFEISITIDIEQAKGIKLECTVYPNPASDFFTLEVKNYDNTNLSYQLYGINGKLIESKKLTGSSTKIQIKEFASTSYLLKVVNNQHEIKTFKLIKNQ